RPARPGAGPGARRRPYQLPIHGVAFAGVHDLPYGCGAGDQRYELGAVREWRGFGDALQYGLRLVPCGADDCGGLFVLALFVVVGVGHVVGAEPGEGVALLVDLGLCAGAGPDGGRVLVVPVGWLGLLGRRGLVDVVGGLALEPVEHLGLDALAQYVDAGAGERAGLGAGAAPVGEP